MQKLTFSYLYHNKSDALGAYFYVLKILGTYINEKYILQIASDEADESFRLTLFSLINKCWNTYCYLAGAFIKYMLRIYEVNVSGYVIYYQGVVCVPTSLTDLKFWL